MGQSVAYSEEMYSLDYVRVCGKEHTGHSDNTFFPSSSWSPCDQGDDIESRYKTHAGRVGSAWRGA